MDKHIRDKNGNLLFIVRQTTPNYIQVLDKNGTQLGFIRGGDTFDKNGRLLARGENIGLLTVGS